jgi:hypothetical protein
MPTRASGSVDYPASWYVDLRIAPSKQDGFGETWQLVRRVEQVEDRGSCYCDLAGGRSW